MAGVPVLSVLCRCKTAGSLLPHPCHIESPCRRLPAREGSALPVVGGLHTNPPPCSGLHWIGFQGTNSMTVDASPYSALMTQVGHACCPSKILSVVCLIVISSKQINILFLFPVQAENKKIEGAACLGSSGADILIMFRTQWSRYSDRV